MIRARVVVDRDTYQFREFTNPEELQRFLVQNPGSFVINKHLPWVRRVLENIQNSLTQ